jgi:hypothetical protein
VRISTTSEWSGSRCAVGFFFGFLLGLLQQRRALDAASQAGIDFFAKEIFMKKNEAEYFVSLDPEAHSLRGARFFTVLSFAVPRNPSRSRLDRGGDNRG